MVDMMLSWNPKGALLTSKFAIIHIDNTYLPNDVNNLLSPSDFLSVLIFVASSLRDPLLMYLISGNNECQVISCILSAYYLSLLTMDIVLQTVLHIMFDCIFKS